MGKSLSSDSTTARLKRQQKEASRHLTPDAQVCFELKRAVTRSVKLRVHSLP